MLKVFQGWVQRYFSDEEAVVLAVVLAVTGVVSAMVCSSGPGG